MNNSWWRALLIASLCAVIGLVDAIRRTDAVPVFVNSSEQTGYLLKLLSGFGQTGPAWNQRIDREDWLQLQQAIPSDVEVMPFGIAETVVRNVDGQTVPLRVLDVNAEILALLPKASGEAPGCGHDRIWFGESRQRRLGLSSGQWTRIGDRTALIETSVSKDFLRMLPGVEGVDGIRCVTDPFSEDAAPVEQALLLTYKDVTESELKARVAALSRDDGAFREMWQLIPLEEAAKMEGQRRLGWLLGLEWLIVILAVGTLVLLRSLEEVGHSGDGSIRQALGEQKRHRIKRQLGNGVREGLWILAFALVWTMAGAWLAQHWMQQDLTATQVLQLAMPKAAMSVLVLTGLRFVTDQILGIVLTPKQVHQTGTRSAGRNRPALIAIGLAALLCGSICVPAAFMIVEFCRHASLSPGYETKGLYATRLVLLDYDSRNQTQWWHLLEGLRGEVTQSAGVSAAGYMTPTPWDFARTNGVVANEEGMILNVALSADILPMLSPTGWNGREITDVESMSEVIVQNLEEGHRRNFIPMGTTLIGEIRGLRYSPLDETGRPAILRSLRAGIGHDVNLVVKADGDESHVIDNLDRLVSRQGEMFAAGPFVSVDRIISDRMASVRTSATVSMMVAMVAVTLLAITLLAAIRLYVAFNRRELSIRLCLGAPTARVQARLLGRSLMAIGAGWALGTMAGLALWHQIVYLIRDHRLVQPWSSAWLFLAALLLIAAYIWHLARTSLRHIALSEALKA